MADDADDPPDADEVMIWNRQSGRSVGFTLPRQYDELIEWLERHHNRRTSPRDFARRQGWLPPSKPSRLRLFLAKLRG
ncbi:hypothetical protein [Nocardia asiatica]|uniref:hypothetical protein n=1 Tax=Nocardia asiatica TaxID=209252 RepID=UPI002455E665|nr:hypothetical protein [Nocardia asiatica]